MTYLTLSVAENNSLGDCKGVVEVAQRIKFPLFALDGNKELLDSLQCQFITLHENAYWIGHELARHLQYLVRQCR